MAANDRGSKSDTAFHPLFATEKHSDTIFESSDGISFYYDWDRLAVFSSFFEDLKSINNVSREAVHTEKEAVIPLPTTSAALAYALGAINTTLRGSPPPELELVHFNDVLTLADSLELPMVTHVLLRTAKAAQMTPCIVVVLSILAQDTSDFRDLSLALLAHPVDHMSTWSLESLKRRAPLSLIAIYDLHRRWRKAIHFSSFPIHGNFARTCNRHCKNTHQYQSFFNLVKNELKNVTQLLMAQPPLVFRDDYYTPNLGCDECNRRVQPNISRALCSFSSNDYTLIL